MDAVVAPAAPIVRDAVDAELFAPPPAEAAARRAAARARRPRAALWDLDGTLIDTEPVYFAGFAHAARALGRPNYSWDFHVQHINGRPEKACMENFLTGLQLPSHVTPSHVLALRNEHAIAAFPHVGVLSGVVETLDALAAAGLPLAIATSSARRGSTFAPKTSTKADLLARFAAVVCVDDDAMSGKHGKPAPDVFLVAAAALGVAPEFCVVFEDSIAGVTAGVAAGAVVVAVPDARNRAAAWAAGAHYVLRSLDEFSMDMIGLEEEAAAAGLGGDVGGSGGAAATVAAA